MNNVMMSPEFFKGLFKLLNVWILHFLKNSNNWEVEDIFVGLLHASKSMIKRKNVIALSILNLKLKNRAD